MSRSALMVTGIVAAGLTAVVLLGVQLVRGFSGPGVHHAKPNILLITLDTCRRDHLSVYGYARDTSPALRELAKDAFVFDNAFTVATNSAPSHATILTGLYPFQHGLVDNGLDLPKEVPTLTRFLAMTGYDTAGFVGYYALGPESQLDQGFRTFELNEVDDHAHETRSVESEMKGFNAGFAWIRAWAQRGQAAPEHAVRPDPFFVWLHVQQIHMADPPRPYDSLYLDVPREQDVSGFDKGDFNIRCYDDVLEAWLAGTLTPAQQRQVVALYDGEVKLVDDHLAKLFVYLKEAGLYDDTMIVVLADHGEYFFDKPGGDFGKVEPAHTATYFDPVLHVPLLIKPAKSAGLTGGTRIEPMVSTVDLVPTLLELLHADRFPWLAGSSRVPLMRDPHATSEERIFFGETPEFVKYAGVRTPEWKLIQRSSRKEGERVSLLDLAHDPAEEHDVATREPAQRDALLGTLSGWLAEQQATDRSSYADMSEKMRQALRRAGYLRDRPAEK